ncbi:MAG: pyridoxal phosphate-dependent aminotransferase [Clostridia bacterium]|nr:pyridoxal phosphate-dependent aminotransferase [Clostridia bacterium]
MINKKMLSLGKKSSVIREIFEYGKKRKNEIGSENVFDFSLGNPSVPAPEIVNETLKDLINNTESTLLHGYTSAPGDIGVRTAIANYINETYGVSELPENIFMTCGAAASLTISLNALLNKGEEVVVFAPFFPEYRVFIEKAGAVLVSVKSREEDFQPDFEKFEQAITEKTKAVIINSPNNPTGAVLSEETIVRLCSILQKKSDELEHPIYLISDEPYRELVYDEETKVPYITKYYKNSIVCYSFSKSLSLPGERIGYVLVSSTADDVRDVFFAVCGAARSLGYVCAPAMFQYLIPDALGKTGDIAIYKKNRDILYNTLTSYGYRVSKPDGAFYLFVKALEPDANQFCERAKKYELLLVPSDDFDYEGYVRISYCVSTEQIERSLSSFEKLYLEYAEKEVFKNE